MSKSLSDISSIDTLVQRLKAEHEEHFLYRGQNDLFGPDRDFGRQIPSVFRGARSQRSVSKLLEKSHLETAWLFDKVRRRHEVRDDQLAFDLDGAALQLGDLETPAHALPILAIAQHYGIKTQVLDLAGLRPAAVFATQRWMTLREAASLKSGTSARVQSEFGVLYRYDLRKLRELGIRALPLGAGYAGSRPIMQEASAIAIDHNQDIELLRSGAYEVFPFRQTEPFTYASPVEPAPYLTPDQEDAVRFASTTDGSTGAIRDVDISMRDLVWPTFYFVELPLPYQKGTWNIQYGRAPDPCVVLGRLCEEYLVKESPIRSARVAQYSKVFFGERFGCALEDVG